MRLFVTGGTGLVGSNVIAAALERGFEVIASQYGPEPDWDRDYHLDPLDLSDPGAVRAALLRHRPEVVIHCAALLDQVFMYRRRKAAWRFMVEGTDALARACREVGARLVFVSTDWVFDGCEPLVDESSPPSPVGPYGLMKLVSEQRLSALDELDWAVGRLAAVYGLNPALPELTRWEQGVGLGDLANDYARRALRGEPIEVWQGDINLAAHPTLASDAGEMLVELASSGANGVFHTCGSESIDRLDLARLCAGVFGGDPERVRRVPVPHDVATAHAGIRIPQRIVMSVDRTAETLGRRGLGVREGLDAFKAQIEEGGYP